MTATLDRVSKDYAILTLADGRMFDVYGDNWAELRAEAETIAAHVGDVTIEIFNSEIPEV